MLFILLNLASLRFTHLETLANQVLIYAKLVEVHADKHFPNRDKAIK